MKRLKRSSNNEPKDSQIKEDVETFSASSLRLFEEGTLSDVTLVVGDKKEEVKAHKFVLVSRSEVFRAMLCGNFTENSGNVEITDIQPDILRTLLRYMYSGRFEEPTEETVVSLLYAAEKYGIRGFANKCDLYLQKNLSHDNYCTILNMATLFNKEKLIRECLIRASVNCISIFESKDFLTLTYDSLYALLESDYLDTSEGLIFKACIKWGENQCEKKDLEKTPENVRKCLGGALQLIRFTSMSIGSFSSEVSKENILTADEKVALFQSFVEKSNEFMEYNFTSAPRRDPATRMICTKYPEDYWTMHDNEDFIELCFNKDTVLVAIDFLVPDKEGDTADQYCGTVEISIREDREILHSQKDTINPEYSELKKCFLRPCFTLKANRKYILSLTFQGDRIALIGREGVADILYHKDVPDLELQLQKGTLLSYKSLRLCPFEDSLTSFDGLYIVLEK